MRKITYNHAEYSVKSEWNELTPKEFTKISWIQSTHNQLQDQSDLYELKFLLFSVISNFPNGKYEEILASEWVDLLETTSFLFKTPNFKTNPLPKFTIKNLFGKQVIAGPVGLMATSSFAEFMNVDAAFLDFHNNKNEDAAWLVLATLWRPQRVDILKHKKDAQKWDGDYRVPYNQNYTDELVAYYKRTISLQYAVAALLYYESVRDQVLVKNKLLRALFTKGSGSSSTKTIRTSLSHTGWLSALIEMSGKKFGDFESTARTNWVLVLVDLANEVEKAQQLAKK